jgi:hypothetical protein
MIPSAGPFRPGLFLSTMRIVIYQKPDVHDVSPDVCGAEGR